MKKTDVNLPTFVVSTASPADFPPVRRLIVLVPESDLDIAMVARRLRELANAFGNHILLFGLSKDATHEPGLRRQVVALSAMLRDEHVLVDSKVEIGGNWPNALRSELRHEDVIACFSAQYPGFARKPLHQFLESNLKSTVYVLDGALRQKSRLPSKWISETLAWGGSIGLVLGFFWLQTRIVQLPQDWSHTLLLYLSLFAEVGGIWLWNKLVD